MSERLHGLDIIRLVSFFAIATFHVSLIHYYTAGIDIAEQSLVIRAVEQTARVLSFSGFTICFLSSLLTAFSGSSLKKRIRLFAFLIIGWAAFSALMIAPEDTWFVWDIYPLIFVGIMICSIVQLYSEKILRVLGILGFCMLWIPFWDFRSFVHLPGDLQIVMGFGECPTDLVEWPIFPWIGLVFFGYWAGNEFRHLWQSPDRGFFKMKKPEMAAWSVALAASSFRLGDFYGIHLGQAFACEAYRQPPVVWWSHFIWPMFLIRLSFEPRIQGWLTSFSLARWISRLAISRKFWLAYFANYLVCYALSALVSLSGVEKTEWNVPVIAFIAVFLVPFTEIVTRLILLFARLIQSAFKGIMPMPANLKNARGESGSSLLMVMIVIAVLGGMVGSISLLVRNRIDARVLNSTLAGRQFVFEQTKENASSPEALRASAVNDPALAACVYAGGGGDCAGGPNAATLNARSLNLYVPFSSDAPPTIVASPSSSVVSAHYNWRGLRNNCITTGPTAETCMFWATVTWWAECPKKALTCDKAYRIYVLPQIRELPTAKGPDRASNVMDKDKFPSDVKLDEEKARAMNGQALKYSAAVLTTDIRGEQAVQVCPFGMLVTGTQANGSVICDCEHGFKKALDASGDPIVDDATGWPKCDPVAYCTPPKILAGINAVGEAKCVVPAPTDYICDDTRQISSNGSVACLRGYRMRQLKVNRDCYVVPRNAPLAQQYVDCGDMQITCCRLR